MIEFAGVDMIVKARAIERLKLRIRKGQENEKNRKGNTD